MSTKHSSKAEQAERHDTMIQRRTAATVDELPRVPMFPGVVEGGKWEGESLGCEGDAQSPDPAPSVVPIFTSQKTARALKERRQGLRTSQPEKAAPAPASTVRWALWSDGSLDIRGPDGWVQLGAEDLQRLREYLGRMGGEG